MSCAARICSLATGLHRLLQILLDLPTPDYHHHELLRDAAGRKLSKSLRAKSLRVLRQEGLTPGSSKPNSAWTSAATPSCLELFHNGAESSPRPGVGIAARSEAPPPVP